MKVIILCGGLGSRIAEETKKIPKPMIKIGKIPILLHIMNIYAKYGYKDFILALGYKKNFIKKFFKDKKIDDWAIKCVDTGKNTLTGTRLLKLKKYIKPNSDFFLTYGDGVTDLNLNKLFDFHKKNKRLATVTAVHPPARFGQMFISKNFVKKFKEKNQTNSGWINGGFFVFNSKIFNLIPKKSCMLERDPIQNLLKANQLTAFKHSGFWQCMDTPRDKKLLNEIWRAKKSW
tara:strand:+ start:145 stop:840 length:696 start_codon:yes stop_codon:yes gene_type:complete